ncbi:hypothetical protein ScPMuIL_006822 [Solemya velum]
MTEKNYTQFTSLHTKYAESKGLRILVFPCNQFASQEPWPNEQIKGFLIDKFQAEFEMFGKIDVNGSHADPLFNFLKSKQSGFLGNFIKWNFTKFLIDKDGKPVKRYGPSTEPNAIEKDLPKYW